MSFSCQGAEFYFRLGRNWILYQHAFSFQTIVFLYKRYAFPLRALGLPRLKDLLSLSKTIKQKTYILPLKTLALETIIYEVNKSIQHPH